MVKQEELIEDFSFSDLFKAYFDCTRHKRNTKSALEFELNLERNLLILYKELKNGTYKIGRSVCFIVSEPKLREVWASCFRDRIVHHLVYNAIKARFHKRFIKDTYNSIPERGTLAAAKRLLHFTRSATNNYTKKACYLKADLSNFFASIDKQILFKLLKKQVKEKWISDLLEQIIFHDPRSNVFVKSGKKLFDKLPSHKSLWNRSSNSCGLPIGNMTSQFFSNVYLNELDWYVKKTLKCKYYLRYVDDFVIIFENPKQLNLFYKKIDAYLKFNLKLRLNPLKKLINTVVHGIDFVGYFVLPNRILLRKRILNKIRFRIRKWKQLPDPFCEQTVKTFSRSINSYLGLLRNTASFNFRFELCSLINCLFLGVDKEFTRCIPRCASNYFSL